jgi:hypothetical protein
MKSMDLYDTEFENADVVGLNDARSVDAWIRAAAYAAGEDPEVRFSGARADAALSDPSEQVELFLLG